MRMTKILAMLVAIAMTIAVVPGLAITASAAGEEEQVLFDLGTADWAQKGGGELKLEPTQKDWTLNKISNDEVQIAFNAKFDKSTGLMGDSTTNPYALTFFRKTVRKVDGNNANDAKDGKSEAVYLKSETDKTKNAKKITISFNLGLRYDDAHNDNFQTWTFKDTDGIEFAQMYYDVNKEGSGRRFAFGGIGGNETVVKTTGDEVLALAGKNITITAERNSDNKYTVKYMLDGKEEKEETVDPVNGFASIAANVGRYNDQWSAGGMMALKITYELGDYHAVTATYKAENNAVKTIEAGYDGEITPNGYTFPEYVYGDDGNVYHATGERTLADNRDITAEKCENFTTKPEGTKITFGDKIYTSSGKSIVANGNFITGTADGWTNRKKQPMDKKNHVYIENDEEKGCNVFSPGSDGKDGDYNIGTKWTVENGKSYYLAFDIYGNKVTDSNLQYNVIVDALKDDGGYSADGTKIMEFGKLYSPYVVYGWKHLETVFEAQTDTVYMQSSFFEGIKIANFELVEVTETPSTVVTVNFKDGDNTVKTVKVPVEAGQTVDIPETEVFYNGKFYICGAKGIGASETEQNIEVSAEPNKYGASADTFATANWDNSKGSKDVLPDLLFTGASGNAGRASSYDSDLAATTTKNISNGVADGGLGFARVAFISFADVPKPTEKQMAVLKVFVVKSNQNLGHNTSEKIATTVYEGESIDDSKVIKWDESKHKYDNSKAIWSDNSFTQNTPTINDSGLGDVNEYVSIDVTDAIKNASDNNITFALYIPTAGAYIANRESAVAGGANEGKAAYIEIEDGVNVTVTGTVEGALITKNGSKMANTTFAAKEGDVVRVYNGTKAEGNNGETPFNLAYVKVNGAEEAKAEAVTVAGETKIEAVVAPELKEAVLGWDGTDFTIDFMFGDFTPVNGVEYGIGVKGEGGGVYHFQAMDEGKNGVAVKVDKPARRVSVNSYLSKNSGGNAIGATGSKEDITTSVYELVTEAIAKGSFSEANKINVAQAEAAAKVIAGGGIYINNGALTDETQRVLEINGTKVKIKDDLFKAGLKFAAGEIKYSEATGEVKTVTVEEGAQEIDLEAVELSENATIYLEGVEFVFEPVVENAADETVSGELDFVEEV